MLRAHAGLATDCMQNVVGQFLLPGSRTVPFVYTVQKIRDGRSYTTRTVNVTQDGSEDICFTCTCSFKGAETSPLDVQEKVDLWRKYKVALEGKKPENFEECPGVDVPWYWKLRKETGHNDKFPGLESTKVNMEIYNKDRHPLDRRGLIFYRTLGHLPPDPNLHLVAHLYASDRNSLYIVANQLDVGDLYTQMSSLVHTTIFHTSMEHLCFGPSKAKKTPMEDTGGNGRWFGKEDFTTRASAGRAMYQSRVWSSDGTHVATLMQDGMIRFSKKPEATSEEIVRIRDRKRKWKPREKL